MSRAQEDYMAAEEEQRSYLAKSIASIFTITFVKLVCPEYIPFDIWKFWEMKGEITDWMQAGIPIFVWGVSLSLVLHLTSYGTEQRIRDWLVKREYGVAGTWFRGIAISIWAGVVEEVCFRWLLFLGAMATLRLANFLIFGWLGFGLAEHFHQYVWGPLADFVSFGYLKQYIFNEHGWAVGAALLWSNAFFREGHGYQGWIGIINSWFLGLFFFWMTFTFGLPAAILVHFSYDFVIFTIGTLRIAISDWGKAKA